MKTLEVIVVDDNADWAKLTGLLLRRLGHTPHVFNTAQAALDAVPRVKPDLILSDVRMPGMDGCELASRVRQLPGFEKVVLAAVTAHGDVHDTQQVIEAGFDYRFIKPMQLDELHQFTDAVAGESS